MEHWKFILIGITGDLAQRKILPAVSQFASRFKDQVRVELLGYSRSIPDTRQINSILDLHSEEDTHVLANIQYQQGSYEDPGFFIDVMNSLKDNERTVVYFAVPPHVFLTLLQTFCPYGEDRIDIIIEKPFGRDLQEARAMLKKITSCGLEEEVHFCDHYLFKDTARIRNLPLAETLEHNYSLRYQDITSIRVQALESLDVQDRGGYYDTVGALKDMLPAHLFSMASSLLMKLTHGNPSVAAFFKNIEVTDLSLGQYHEYTSDIGVETSTTDTYFSVEGKNGFHVYFESGKKLAGKCTGIRVEFSNDFSLKWNIAPRGMLEVLEGNRVVTSWNLNNGNTLDHTNMFEDILRRTDDRFVDNESALEGWKFYEKVVAYQKKRAIVPQIY
ncbi:MAG: hypothetical protein ACOCXT_03470 [Candidatus Dojkabacteria bacterium]